MRSFFLPSILWVTFSVWLLTGKKDFCNLVNPKIFMTLKVDTRFSETIFVQHTCVYKRILHKYYIEVFFIKINLFYIGQISNHVKSFL